jgi:hypothetical protein
MSFPIHRNTDKRSCGAQTIAIGQSTVFINGLLASVEGDPNTHKKGELLATMNDGSIFINNKKVVMKGSASKPDLLHPKSPALGASPNVYASGGKGPAAAASAGVTASQAAQSSGTNGSMGGGGGVSDPNAANLDAEEAGARSTATDPSAGGNTNTGAVGAPSASVQAREQQALQYYIDLGYTPEQAAGIVGNLTNESGLSPTIVTPNDAGPGLDSEGIAQWNRDRLVNLKGFAADRGTTYQDFETQLAFVDHEMRGSGANAGGTERAAYNRLIQTNNPQDAAVAFSTFERYRGYKLGIQGRETQERANDATRILNAGS